jgi:hypothetical protein
MCFPFFWFSWHQCSPLWWLSFDDPLRLVWVLGGVFLPIPIALFFSYRQRFALGKASGTTIILLLFLIEMVNVYTACLAGGCGHSGGFMVTIHFVGNLVFAGLHGWLLLILCKLVADQISTTGGPNSAT